METSNDNDNNNKDNNKIIDNRHDDEMPTSLVSIGQLSELHHQRTAVNLKNMQKKLNYLLYAYFPLALGVLIMACMWSDIAGMFMCMSQ